MDVLTLFAVVIAVIASIVVLVLGRKVHDYRCETCGETMTRSVIEIGPIRKDRVLSSCPKCKKMTWSVKI